MEVLNGTGVNSDNVLNLVINGLPSILKVISKDSEPIFCFKPCYKWITFNTEKKTK